MKGMLPAGLTPTQREVIERLKAEGATRRVRWSGGFWTTPGASHEDGKPHVPSWYVDLGTVRALEALGVLRRAHTGSAEWHDPRELVPEE